MSNDKTTTGKINYCEAKGRKLLYAYAERMFPGYDTISFTPDCERHDAEITRGSQKFYVEVKCRNNSNSKYSSGIIKATKRKWLESKIKEGHRAVYVYFYDDNTCRAWDLQEIKTFSLRSLYVKKTEMDKNSPMEWQDHYDIENSDGRLFA